jgi:Flp pilus assembly protein TadG
VRRVSRWGRQRGAVAVEFALVLPLLLLLVLGGIDYGYYFFVSEIAANAAREGARAGAISRSLTPCLDGGGIPGAVTVVKDFLKRGALISSDGDARLKAFTCTATTSCCQVVTIAGFTGQSLEVRVVYQAKPGSPGSMSITGFLGMKQLLPNSVTTTATMRLEP